VVRQDAEETFAARIAAEGVEAGVAFQKEQSSHLDAFSGDSLEIEISTLWTVREAGEHDGDAAAIEAVVAGVAAPGPQLRDREQVIEDAGAVRTETVRAPALRTDHLPRGPPFGREAYTKWGAGAMAGRL
jgi:hypothetical protein